MPLSPCEFIYALLLAVAADINAAAEDETLLKWRNLMLSVNLRLHVLDNEADRLWMSNQLRESQVQAGDAVRHSAIQRMCAVLETKAMLEKRWA